MVKPQLAMFITQKLLKKVDNLHISGYRMNARQSIYTTSVFENSLKIAQAFRRVQLDRIFKYHMQCCQSLIARALTLIYHMTEKIMKGHSLICCSVQINNVYLKILSKLHKQLGECSLTGFSNITCSVVNP